MIVWINGASDAGKTTTARELVDLIPNSTLFDPEVIDRALARLLPAKRLAEVRDVQDLPVWRRLVVDTAAALLAELGGVLVIPQTLLRQDYRDEIFGGLAARRIPVRHLVLAPAETILRARIADRRTPRDLAGGADVASGGPGGEVGGPGVATGGSGAVSDGAGAGADGVGGDSAHADSGVGGAGSGVGGTGAAAAGASGVRELSDDRIEPYRAALGGWLAADAHLLDTSACTARESAVRIAEAVRTGAVEVCDIVQTPEPTAETLASGVLLFDDQDRVLLVDPTYKAGWEFPGGVVEPGEAPARAGMREVAEETGIHLDDVPRLLVVDWESPVPPAYGGLRLLFDGGRLNSGAASGVLLPGPELRDFRFVTEEEAARLLPPVRYERLRWALRAREQGTPVYLEAGMPV